MDMPPVQLAPDEWQETTLVFDCPGQYTFYCDRWCGPEHWRMRGIIEVNGDEDPGVPIMVSQPLYLALNIDVDAPHPAPATPKSRPSPERGAALATSLPGYVLEAATYLASSPAALYQRLRAEPGLLKFNNGDLWDATAWIWQHNTSLLQLEIGRELYAQQCAACHGETGRGDGVMVRNLPEFSHESMSSGHVRTRPPDLTDAHNTLGASPALLEGKLLRGGMGTGMPMWGTIFNQQQMDALVSYLYTLVDYQ